ncbi:cation:proton antiporter [Streptomyces sp. NPDC052036]|uniref:cation:proton antiporter n=1 Tax=unclassified Streptomyces TaxID=2593676 RepID=UPI00341515EA
MIPALVGILVASAVCGRLARMVGQPRVLGEMVAGVLLGPTLLGAVAPGLQTRLFPQEVKPVLYVLSTLGLTLYMFLVGVGLDHGSQAGGERGEGRKALILAVSGIAPSLLLGFGVGFLWYQSLSGPGVSRLEFAFFVGGALSITAFPMLARILYERRLENSRLGRLSLVGASIDDAVAWCLLAVLVVAHSGNNWWHAVRTIVLAAVFAAVMLLVVSRVLRPLGERVARTGQFGPGDMYMVCVTVLAAGWFTDYIGVYSVFGGFIAGLAMPRDPAFREALHARTMEFVCVFLLPVFFALSGLNTKLNGVSDLTLVAAFLSLLLAGFVGKYFGCGLAMRGMGFPWRESLAVGGLMNARGLMILIFINIGLAQHMISQDVFSLLVLVAVVTTAGALPLYRWALPERVEAALGRPVSMSSPLGSPSQEPETVAGRGGAG